MTLAAMMSTDEDALICDFAEYYHILDYKGLRPSMAAVLSFGLPDSSRIKAEMAGYHVRMDRLMQAVIIDHLALLTWFQSEDGHKNRNRPKSFVEALTGQKHNDVQSFSTAEAFEAARARILGKDENNG